MAADSHLDTDVAVVGAGLAGLVAARDLVRAGLGVIVLEARDRVGGRTLNEPVGADPEQVVELGGQWFGPTQHRVSALARRPERYVEKVWSEEPYSGGGYAGYMPPGAWTDHGAALRAAIGPLHWAGSETATIWNGYMDGAIQSGQRAAREVASALG
ncbi:FAD-dependent oxidoreductase [Conexibacter stalactiti]|uniref:FAD-dependent oxidoreductase n=1 Tax=Conexibacter stalactiti TaxID=1940611 RepID=A0ABU4I1N3_9ACTN|nr:FAD-dependent oxidoreductase [Conexibacter stalactiti]MDW5598625.1 FAD-dependent oxidoreductase [Conexibacter stalactiti]MEC5039267.1 FAD-dependent oxidoreductase [Conexibacter stalactiti]